ncbi:MAG: hypothetical protein LCH44_11120 [Bacteroidetes bacterium]|nr:hypothetical protein [Bacteroidota bacterium]
MKYLTILFAITLLSCQKSMDKEDMYQIVRSTPYYTGNYQKNLFDSVKVCPIKYYIQNEHRRNDIEQMAIDYSQRTNKPCVEVSDLNQANYLIP